MPPTSPIVRLTVAAGAVAAVIGGAILLRDDAPTSPREAGIQRIRERRAKDPRVMPFDKLSLWWDGVPDNVAATGLATGPDSNIHPDDYTGPESCAKCHTENYSHWLDHPHRLMNAQADDGTVRGDFSDGEGIDYLGGHARFHRDGDEFRMSLSREGIDLTYAVHQTIGSRFFQYYVGMLIDGDVSDDHIARSVDHVLPFGYWLDRSEWVPVVHLTDELPDGQRADPFALPAVPQPGVEFAPYAMMCNLCHTTFPLADSLARKPNVVGQFPPAALHFEFSDYVQNHHPDFYPAVAHRSDATDFDVQDVGRKLALMEAPEHAVTLGISCEACHHGCAEHARNKTVKPRFLPHSPHLTLASDDGAPPEPKSAANVNWICSRCHTGHRPQLAAGMSTWNSTEFSDAMRGSCYSQLKCIDCHSPHQGIGSEWPRTAAEDDQSCIRCHTDYSSDEAVAAHTHHRPGSSGARCLNCHMPRMNEGLQNVVRTHMIFSPTEKSMIESNHPNACNICHTDRSINWTVGKLQEWYGATLSDDAIRQNYADPDGAVAAGWLASPNEAVRLIATDAIARSGDTSLLRPLIKTLDDPYLLNRQFASIALEQMVTVPLSDFGYQFYMTDTERAEPISRILDSLKSGTLPIRETQGAKTPAE